MIPRVRAKNAVENVPSENCAAVDSENAPIDAIHKPKRRLAQEVIHLTAHGGR